MVAAVVEAAVVEAAAAAAAAAAAVAAVAVCNGSDDLHVKHGGPPINTNLLMFVLCHR